MYCGQHREDGMVDVVSKRCGHSNCNLIASFAYKGERPMFCSVHKDKHMVNIFKKICQEENCDCIASYNVKGCKKAIYCREHRLSGMVNIRKNICEVHDCLTSSIFNFPGERGGRFCSKHKEEGMVNIYQKNCLALHCQTTGSKKYDGYCKRCFIYLFPLDSRTIACSKHTKELKVRTWLIENWNTLFIHDIPLWSGDCSCSHRRRIDFRCIINNFLIAVEVDENQHKRKRYQEDEENRYNDLMMMHGGPMIFIRYNPDPFRLKNGKIRKVKDMYRKKKLVERIQYWISFAEQNEKVNWLLKEEKLYFDE